MLSVRRDARQTSASRGLIRDNVSLSYPNVRSMTLGSVLRRRISALKKHQSVSIQHKSVSREEIDNVLSLKKGARKEQVGPLIKMFGA